MSKLSQQNFFNVAIKIKLIDGLLGILGGVIAYYIDVESVNKFIHFIFIHELTEDPQDFLLNRVFVFLKDLDISTQVFIAWYLFINGVLKVFLVIGLLKKRLWAYPLAASVFILLVIYEFFRIFYTHSIVLFFIIIIDIFIIYFITQEYQTLIKKQSL
jgi:uncharacterized membrane protein